VLAALTAGLVLLGAFAVIQARRPYAVLDVRLFRVPSFTGAVLLTFLARICSFGILPYLILWLQGMLGHSPLETGLRLLAMTLPILIVAPLAGRLGQQIPASRLLAGGFALIAVAFALMARVGPDSDWAVAFPGLVLLGVGGALAFPPLLGVTLDVVPRERAGMASGLSNTFFPLGTATGVAAFGAIFTARIDAALPGQAAPGGRRPVRPGERARPGGGPDRLHRGPVRHLPGGGGRRAGRRGDLLTAHPGTRHTARAGDRVTDGCRTRDHATGVDALSRQGSMDWPWRKTSRGSQRRLARCSRG
jgi:hypothetical protein